MQDENDRGARLSDLTRDGDVAFFIDREVGAVAAQRDAYREIAIEKEAALLEMARQDVEEEARRRVRGRPNLRAI
jgi:hypothetical protein